MPKAPGAIPEARGDITTIGSFFCELNIHFGGDLLMGQEALEEQRGIILAKQVEDLARPKNSTGIGDDVEAAVSRLTEKLDLL